MSYEDTSIGGLTWHSSGPDEGPDVGVSIYLGEDDRLWAGEITRDLFDRCNGVEHFENDFGWFLVRYTGKDTHLIARFAEKHEALEFMDQVAAWVRATAH